MCSPVVLGLTLDCVTSIVVPDCSSGLDRLKEAARHVNAVERGLVEFAAFVVVVARQTHINPVELAISAADGLCRRRETRDRHR